jgi:hypothetical protein
MSIRKRANTDPQNTTQNNKEFISVAEIELFKHVLEPTWQY